jgi:mRNA-degrading endonuclease toxin of MazEF toxin-antitoxin module
MSTLCRGRIVWVELLDPQGHNPKRRPAVVISPDADIHDDGEVWVVAISSQLGESPAEQQVALPWHPRGHPRTGLKERCAAVCTWLVRVPVASIQSLGGVVPGRQLLDIQTRIRPLDPAEEPPTP